MPDTARSRSRREACAGALIATFGVAALLEGRRLGTGSLTAMGPGFVPMTLGVILCGLGLLIALMGQGQSHTDDAGADHAEIGRPDWRGILCILLGAVAFIVLGQYAGLVPAGFASVFIAALGDRTTRLRPALVLAAGVTVFGCVLFGYVLRIPIPLLRLGF